MVIPCDILFFPGGGTTKVTVRKKFDRDLWKENDKKARKGVEKLISKFKGLEVRPHKDHRKVDLELFKNGKHIANVETEIKRVWKAKQFQYESVQFPERKKKFCGLEKPTIFVMFNFDMDNYLVVTDTDLINSPVKEVPNKYVYKDEYFFQVPLDNVYMGNIKEALKEIGVL